MLTAAQQAAREGKLTASHIGVLMNGDDAALYDLWRECTGDPSCEPPDLSGVWAVQLGSHTESLNLAWYERKTGRPVTRLGKVVVSPERNWAAATLDGWDDGHSDGQAVIEAKHTGGFEPLETIVARCMPQLHWQMYCCGNRLAILSVIQGAREPVLEEIMPVELLGSIPFPIEINRDGVQRQCPTNRTGMRTTIDCILKVSLLQQLSFLNALPNLND